MMVQNRACNEKKIFLAVLRWHIIKYHSVRPVIRGGQ